MVKRSKIILLMLLACVMLIAVVAIVACGPSTPVDKTIEGVTFDNVTVDYDGQEHAVTVKGSLPDGANVSYEGNKGTNAGVYNAKATVTCQGYKTLTLTATLTINRVSYNMSAVQWDYTQAFTYDGTAKTVTLGGSLPQGVTVKAYTGNTATDTGSYTAKVSFNYDAVNYNEPQVADCNWVIKGLPITGVTLSDLTVGYDGQEHEIKVVGTLPQGADVVYERNKATDAGTYNVKATVTCKGYNALELTATLTINKADIVASLTDQNIEYDALPHSIQVVGNIPSGATVSYYYNDVQKDEVTEVGEYNVRCVISGGKNHNDKTLTATLKITSTEEQLYSVVTSNGSVYFQNNLDGNKLYKVNGSAVQKINNDVPNYMIADGNDLYYYSTSLFSRVIKNYDGTNASSLLSAKGEYLTTDGTNIYYAVNNMLLNTDQNGIYKIKLDGSDAEPTRLTNSKAAYLTYVNGYIYYANKSDGDKLYRVSVTANNAQGTQLRGDKKDEKVAYIITDGTNLYFNSTKAALGVVGYAAAVTKYNVANGTEVKLTTDAGKYLTKIGSYIYYVNNDKITSALFGDGIYKVSAVQTSDNNSVGTKVLSIDNNGYSSLTSDGVSLYYYKLNDKHFYKNSADGRNETDLMASFQPVEDTSLAIGSYSSLAEYNGEIYFTNPLDYGCLYKYNPATKAKYKVLADSVADFAFYTYQGKNYMYYSAYTFVNYALFRMDLSNGETVKISSSRYGNFIFEGDKVYCIRFTAGNNRIVSMSLDGANETVLYQGKNDSPDTTRLYKKGDTFYFIMNPAVGYRNVSSFTIGASEKVNLQKALSFVMVNNDVYYYSSQDKALKKCGIDGGSPTSLVSNVDITYMYEANGKVYYSSKSSQNTGVFEYDIATRQTKKIADKSAHGMTVSDGKLYFLQSQVTFNDDYPAQAAGFDGRLYCYDGSVVKKVA